MASPLAQLVGARVAVWNAAHPKAQLDPRAVLGIAAHEGLGGGIGDNNTSFGPFQLHLGGAFPMAAPHSTPAQAQAYATSPAGIDYALSRIASVAGGLRGLPAITAISTRFERPANPQAEIQDAAAHYGLPLPNLTGADAALGEPGSNRPKPGKKPPPGLLASPGPSLPSPGLLASLMGSSPVTVSPTPVNVPAPSPLQQAFTPIQIPQIPRSLYQPILAGGH